ncbi:MAG: uroporphyrinogen-III synthase [Ignavibacteria bacterium]|nr:uroporphyrinogen-III synthase [Ignavibacteria bacterium]
MSAHAHTVLLTRPPGASDAFERILDAADIGVLHMPMIEIVPPLSWDAADDAIDAIGVYSGVVLTSANAARFFLERCRERLGGLDDVPAVHAVGERTAEAARAFGLDVATVPVSASAGHLAAALGDVSNHFFLQPGSDLMREDFAAQVEARGGKVNRVTVYRAIAPPKRDLAALDQMLIEGGIECIAFFSPSAVRNFTAMIPDFKQATILIAVIGQTTASAVFSSGLRVDAIADEQTAESMAAAIVARFGSAQRIEMDPDMHMDIG